ncbi:MAG: hypothetical protein VXW38_09820, partial [Bacteroidota bacterium]|nr:hypothetical protein [Bacteroidota bacterium]
VYSRNHFGATPPSSYRVPDLPSVLVENPSITNFKVSMELDYVRSESVWNYRVQLPGGGWTETNWYVSANKDSYPIMGEIPTKLYEKFPNMKVDEITYSRTKFYLDSYTHPEFIAKTFVTQDIETTPRNEEFIIIGPEK